LAFFDVLSGFNRPTNLHFVYLSEPQFHPLEYRNPNEHFCGFHFPGDTLLSPRVTVFSQFCGRRWASDILFPGE
jgi:hypothetical protein